MLAIVRLLAIVFAAASATPVNMQLRGREIAAAAPAAADCDACCEEKKLKAELAKLKAHDSDGNTADGGHGTENYMDKYYKAEEAEEKCEQQKADARKKQANQETHEEWTRAPYRTKGPKIMANGTNVTKNASNVTKNVTKK
eukprot:gnl/TRDRNA2_/TRDRNA2_180878_c0_seq1.p2 gnl/TRDRNA2_/TRDRNA2_180878_c0~~gnl/TRDRNA2_/TRDRNA2_180878_c0_seq1.p2  ORF type:complete len:142 (+),score=40.98 gnl/TRDRNA2_/TRDRNA2_180878_c0_seq1:116-541(+)